MSSEPQPTAALRVAGWGHRLTAQLYDRVMKQAGGEPGAALRPGCQSDGGYCQEPNLGLPLQCSCKLLSLDSPPEDSPEALQLRKLIRDLNSPKHPASFAGKGRQRILLLEVGKPASTAV